jgi:hypothetical protein
LDATGVRINEHEEKNYPNQNTKIKMSEKNKKEHSRQYKVI